MKIIKQESEFGTNIFLEDGGKDLSFCYGGNEDLYWTIHNREGQRKAPGFDSFVITKENYGVYSLFEKLYYDIENINIFDNDEEDVPFYIESEEEKKEYLREQQERLEEDRIKYREHNYSNYNELFNPEIQAITWYSDETAHDCANILRIKKEKETFVVQFFIQPPIEGYDEDFHSAFHIPIRFRNSGSSYDPFNVVFMRMYDAMKEVDDVKDNGHQIHIEEYLYDQKRLVKK